MRSSPPTVRNDPTRAPAPPGGAPGSAAQWGWPELDPVLDAAAQAPGSLIQVAVWFRGAPVLDAWRAAPGEAVRGDEAVPVFSVGKGMLTTVALMAVESGLVDLDAPIAGVWPEFASQGKASITLRQVLAHTSGCAAMPSLATPADLADWGGMTARIAAMAPAVPPGLVRRYQALTMSWLVGGLIERVIGTPFPALGGPFPDIWWGIPQSQAERLRPVVPGESPAVPPAADEADPQVRGAIPAGLFPLEQRLVAPALLAGCMPASHTVATARALAAHYAALLPDGARGERLVGDGILAEATAHAPVAGEHRAGWGLGYQLLGPDDAPGSVFGHDGYGGSIAFADRGRRMSVAIVTRRTGLGPWRERILEAVRTRPWTPAR